MVVVNYACPMAKFSWLALQALTTDLINRRGLHATGGYRSRPNASHRRKIPSLLQRHQRPRPIDPRHTTTVIACASRAEPPAPAADSSMFDDGGNPQAANVPRPGGNAPSGGRTRCLPQGAPQDRGRVAVAPASRGQAIVQAPSPEPSRRQATARERGRKGNRGSVARKRHASAAQPTLPGHP